MEVVVKFARQRIIELSKSAKRIKDKEARDDMRKLALIARMLVNLVSKRWKEQERIVARVQELQSDSKQMKREMSNLQRGIGTLEKEL